MRSTAARSPLALRLSFSLRPSSGHPSRPCSLLRVIRYRSSGAENRSLSATPRKMKQSRSLGGLSRRVMTVIQRHSPHHQLLHPTLPPCSPVALGAPPRRWYFCRYPSPPLSQSRHLTADGTSAHSNPHAARRPHLQPPSSGDMPFARSRIGGTIPKKNLCFYEKKLSHFFHFFSKYLIYHDH
jgi:hypothetical protein